MRGRPTRDAARRSAELRRVTVARSRLLGTLDVRRERRTAHEAAVERRSVSRETRPARRRQRTVKRRAEAAWSAASDGPPTMPTGPPQPSGVDRHGARRTARRRVAAGRKDQASDGRLHDRDPCSDWPVGGPDDRLRQPEGRRREDDHRRQRRRVPRGRRRARARGRPRPPGQRHERPRGRPRAPEGRSVYDALVNDVPLGRPRRPDRRSPGLDLIPSSIALAGAEVELAGMPQRERRLARLLPAGRGRRTTTSSSTARRRSAC